MWNERPTPEITIPHLPAHARTWKRYWYRLYLTDAHEIKHLEFTPFTVGNGIFVLLTVGRIGDEGTYAELFGRDTYHLCIGPRGGLSAVDKNAKKRSWVKGRDAWYARAH
jgi:hypothetical protein